MIKRFKEAEGRYIEKIVGQERFAFAHSDSSDFYDLIEWSKTGEYFGSIIMFFDFESGNVYKPFAKKKNVIYSNPVYTGGFYYFLQGDYSEKEIVLYRYIPEKILEKVTELSTDEIDLYNLRVVGESVHIISQQDNFECYYPERISFPVAGNESAIFMDEGKIYFEVWIEEGWDDEKGCATDKYKCYDKVIIKDYKGNTLSEDVGAIYQAADGTWWIA